MVRKKNARGSREVLRLEERQRRLWNLNLALCVVIFFTLAVWWIGIEFGVFPEPTPRMEALMEQADILAIAIFAIDLYSRFRKSGDKAQFLRKNWLQIVVLLPVGMVFRAARAVEELGILRSMRLAGRLSEMPLVIPEVAVAGRLAGAGLARAHGWLVHFSVITDFFKLVARWKGKILP